MEVALSRVFPLFVAVLAASCHVDDAGPVNRPLVPTRKVSGVFRARSGGSLASSADGSTLYAADADNDTLVVVDAGARTVRGVVPVGREPGEVVVADDGAVWVTSRGARSVSVVDPVALRELRRTSVGAEPGGLAVTPDGRQVLVVTRVGATLELFDAVTHDLVRTFAIPPDATHVAAPVPGRAYVTHARPGTVSIVDLASGAVVKSVALAEPPRPGQELRLAGQPTTPVLLPGTTTLFVPHALSKSDATPTDTPDAYLGRTAHVPVVGYALARLDVALEALLTADGTCFGCGNSSENGGDAVTRLVPAAVQHARFHPLAGAVAAATDGEGHFLFVANKLSHNVSAFPTVLQTRDVFPLPVGAGPTGLSLAPTDDLLYVHAAFDHRIAVVRPRTPGSSPEELLEVGAEIVIGASPLPDRLERGRRLFHAADDRRLTDPADGGIACASCHPDGRDDGRTWQFAEGPRNTPCLAGRHLGQTAPYHWDGSLADPLAFHVIVESRMGGSGTSDPVAQNRLTPADFADVFAWLDALAAPDNPRRDQPSAAAVRGRALFDGRAACATCHAGPLTTDNGFHEVGSLVSVNPAPGGHPDVFALGVNTPPLFGLAYTAPYLHDGSAPTLRDRLLHNPGDRHGSTSALTAGELDDLVDYLETI